MAWNIRGAYQVGCNGTMVRAHLGKHGLPTNSDKEVIDDPDKGLCVINGRTRQFETVH